MATKNKSQRSRSLYSFLERSIKQNKCLMVGVLEKLYLIFGAIEEAIIVKLMKLVMVAILHYGF